MRPTRIKRQGSVLIDAATELQRVIRENKRHCDRIATAPMPVSILLDVCGGAKLWVGNSMAELTDDQRRAVITALGGRL